MKQSVAPDTDYHYSCLAPLSSTLKVLYITGSQKSLEALANFTQLETLSFGESNHQSHGSKLPSESPSINCH